MISSMEGGCERKILQGCESENHFEVKFYKYNYFYNTF